MPLEVSYTNSFKDEGKTRNKETNNFGVTLSINIYLLQASL